MATEKELKDRLAKEKAKVNDEKKSDIIRKKAKKQIEKIENELAELGGDVAKGAEKIVTKGKDLAKMTDKEFEEAKKDLADKLGNTEEECENIIKEFKEQRAKAKRSKAKRTKKLQTSGQTTTPKSTEINAKKVLSNASDTIGDKLQSQVDGLESEAKRDAKDKVKDQNLTTAQKNKKVEELVKNEVRKKSKFIADSVAIETKGILSEISNKLGDIDKQLRLTYLRKVKAEVEALIKKMMFGGLTDGAVANMNVTQSQMSAESVNPQMYAEGGGVRKFEEGGYNGWTNYATWVTNLEMFDGMNWDEENSGEPITKDMLEQMVSDFLDMSSELTRSNADRFLSDVNYYEIAEHINDEYGLSDGEEGSKYAKGGKTWIDSGKQNVQTRGSKGTFRAKADKQGISSGQLADKILANPSKYSKGDRKSAQFVENIGVKEEGGEIMTADSVMEFASGGKVRTNSKVVREAVRQHILDSVDDDGEEFDNVDEASTYMSDRFKSEFDYENNKRRIPNDQERFSDYLNGLPFNFKFYNDDIEDFLNSLGINPEGKKYSNEQMNKLYHYLIWKEVSPKYYGYADGGDIMTADTQFEYEEGGRMIQQDGEVVEFFINDYPYYVRKAGDTTHFFMGNNARFVGSQYATAHHIGQHKGSEMYEDLRKWLKGGSSGEIYGKRYRDDSGYYAKGGRMEQGYNDRMDESLGMRHRGTHSQGHKDRRDEAKGMNKAMGNRAYQSVGTMDRMEEGGQLFDDLKIKKGAFTKKAKQRGLSTEAFMRKVLANPSRYDDRTRKQAQLMKNMM